MKVNEISVSSSYTRCSTSTFVTSGKTPIRKYWISKHELYLAEINADDMGKFERIVTPVTVKNLTFENDEKPVFMMDVITGSLYDIVTGQCLTSDALTMTDFVFKKDLGKRLMKFKAEAE